MEGNILVNHINVSCIETYNLVNVAHPYNLLGSYSQMKPFTLYRGDKE